MKLDVLMICSQFPPVYGGAGGQAALLSEYLAVNGWKVAVATLDQSNVGNERSGRYLVYRTFRRGAKSGFARALSTVSLSLLSCWHITVSRPRVTHIHGIYWWSILPAVLTRLLGGKVVLKSTRDGEDDPSTVRNRKFGPLPIGWLYGLSLKFADAIVVLNKSALESAERVGFGQIAHLMKNGVDTPRLERTQSRRDEARRLHGFGPKDQVILFVGYLAEHKGVLDLLQAFKCFEGQSDTHLLLAGPASGFYRELGDRVPAELERLKRSNIDNVIVLGHQEAADMPALYWAADVFVLPSYVEGMPNSLAEAVVAGCRIVSTRIPGVIDTVSESEAWLVEPGDVKALETALIDATNGESRDSSKAAKSVSMSQVTATYLDLYRGIGASPRNESK